MSAAEFKTLREAVGLSISTLVKVIDVDERSIRKWESGKKKVPQDVFDKVVAIDQMITDAANSELEKFKLAPKDAVVLHRYINEEDLHEAHPEFDGLPIMSYGAMIYRLRQKYLDMGVAVSVEFI
jgi:predicted transcriptional regulator